MNTVKLSAGSLFGLATVGFLVMVAGVALFSGVMVAFHPKASYNDCECADISLPSHRVGPRIGSFQSPEIQAPVNTSALNEIKQQSGICIPCQPNYRPVVQPQYPVVVTPKAPVQPYVPSPNVPQPSPVQPNTARYQIALFLDGSAKSQQLYNWFNTDPNLVALKNKCSFEVYTPENALYKTRYVNIVPPTQFPAALFLYPDGGHIHAAGKNTIPGTSAELYADFKLGFEKAKSVRTAAVPSDNAVVKTKGYSWDQSIHPSMQLAQQDCVGPNCPNPANDRWVPGERVVDFFKDNRDSKNLLLWGGASELATYALVGVIAVLIVVFVIVLLTKKR